MALWPISELMTTLKDNISKALRVKGEVSLDNVDANGNLPVTLNGKKVSLQVKTLSEIMSIPAGGYKIYTITASANTVGFISHYELYFPGVDGASVGDHRVIVLKGDDKEECRLLDVRYHHLNPIAITNGYARRSNYISINPEDPSLSVALSSGLVVDDNDNTGLKIMYLNYTDVAQTGICRIKAHVYQESRV